MKKTVSLAIVFAIIMSTLTFVGGFAAEAVLIDDSFEGELSAWTFTNDYAKKQITVDSSSAADGSKSLKFDDDTDTTSPILKSKMFDAAYGENFTISASFKVIEGSNISVFYKFYDADNKQLSGSGSITSKATTWTSASKTVSAPAGTVSFQIWITGGVKTTGIACVDSVKVVKGGEAKAETVPASSSTPVAASVSGDALISDSFENGLGNWTFNNDYAKEHISVESSTAADGSKSLLFNDDSDTTSPVLKSKMFEAAYGETYTISASFKVLEGSNVSVFYKFYDAANKQLSGSGSVTSTATEWGSASKTVSAPEGTESFQIWITGTIKTVGKCYVDNVKVTKSGSATAAPAPSTTPVVVPAGDILFSDSFENDLSQWTLANDYAEQHISIVSTTAHEGSKSLYLVDDSDTAAPTIKGPYIPVVVGEGYKISASFKGENGTMNKIFCKFFDADKKQLSNVSFVSSGNSWNPVTRVFTAPENAAYLSVWVSGVNATTGSSYIDNIIISKATAEEIEKYELVTLPAPKPIEGIPADNDKFHIYLCIGQSNMVGADTIQNPDIVAVDGAYLYNLDGKWEIAQPYPTSSTEYMGFNRYSTVSKGSGRMGPTIGFARGMVTKVPEGVKIGIISNAIGGTTIEQWSKGFEATETRPDRDLYESAVERTKEALAKGGVLKGIIWLQGESCAAKAGYMEKLVKVANGLREEIGVSNADVPFIVTEIPQVRAEGVAVLRTAPQYIENSYVVSSEGLTIFDSIHFDADSQRKLGLRMAELVLDKIYGIQASADEMYSTIYKDIKKEEPKTNDVVYTVLVNGKKLEMDVQPLEAGGRIFVPVRFIFEALGATVSWDDPTQTVTGVLGDKTVIMIIGDENALVNGKQLQMGVAPMLKDMRTLVPIRFVAEGLGAAVGWDEKTFTATIDLK